jgi:glutathione S-transferase
MAMLIFYFAPGSSAMATHIALHETGAEFEPRLLSFKAKEQQRPDYLALNPEGKVPALVIDGRVLTEVAATLYYLAKTYPEAGLWPKGGIEGEAQTVSRMSFIAATVHPARRAGEERWREVFLGRRRALLYRRHPSIPAVLAFCRRAGPRPGELSRVDDSLRPDDGSPGGQEDNRDRKRDRLRISARRRDAIGPLSSAACRGGR